MKRFIAGLLALVISISFVGCNSQKSNDEIVIMDGQFAEVQVIHQMVKFLVEEHTDAKVVIKDEMSLINSYNEMIKGNCDLSNGYDGTLLTTFLKLDPKDVPKDKTLYDFVNEVASKEQKVHLLDKLGTNNTYAVAVPQEIADKYNLNKVSDLLPVADKLIFGAEHEFFSKQSSMKYDPFVKFYGLKFKEGKPIDIGLKYAAIENNKIDVTVAYATDGLNKKANLKILEDDKKFFPEYNGALLVRDDLFERFSDTAPNLEETLNKLGGLFDNETMTNLTYEVDVEGKTPHDVAKAFLQEKGLIK